MLPYRQTFQFYQEFGNSGNSELFLISQTEDSRQLEDLRYCLETLHYQGQKELFQKKKIKTNILLPLKHQRHYGE